MRRNTTPLPNYSFLEDPIDDTTHVVINTGLAAGVVYRYGRVRFAENGNHLNVKFGYSIVRNPDLLTNSQLEPIMKVILDDILKQENKIG